MGFSQQTDNVDFNTAKAHIVFGDLSKKEVTGTITYEFEILKAVDSVFIDANKVVFSNIVLHGLGVQADVEFHNDSNRLIIYNEFKKDERYELKFDYSTQPKKALYFIDWDTSTALSGTISNKQIWTQGQGKYTSNWLPSIDDMNDKIEFDLTITFDKDYEVIANGKLTNKQINDSTTTWHYDMQKPMSSYLVALAIGKYDKKVEYSNSGIPLEMYYYPEDSLKVEPTYRYTKQMFDFLEEEIGVPYAWQNYKQVPVKDFLYAGMENTSTTIFADSFVIDSIAFVDKNYVNVNAHELAHQWFGDLVTETSGTHHWLQEGFATYYALLAERHIFGDAYYYWQLYDYAQELLEQHKARQGTALLNPKSSSTTFYKKGAWVLHVLREKVGDEAFKKGVKNYLLKHQFKNVETDDFISEVEKASGQDLTNFVNTWLEGSGFLYEDYINPLKAASKEIAQMITLDDMLLVSSDGLDNKINRYWENAMYPRVKAHLFSKEMIAGVNHNILKKALKSNDLKIRQAVALSLSKVPLELKTDYETLLEDQSYITIKAALFGLWNSFPEEQNKYLNQTKDIEGFNDKNIRIIWLALALVSDDYNPENETAYFNELTDYTSPKYGFEIRENAFKYLLWISACAENCKENLEQATKHHNWRFSKFAKAMLKSMQ
ncbi:M1 family metallopeptidase [Algibacter agarivorans]|uniref:Aminopeptidase N n=1 Tax=Algibacter agarivorans TaxID=1109741 RepID=A0ABP9GVE5_9FLAO